MTTKIKGIYKGFKYNITQIFVGKWGVVVVKEQEMEIGNPTDVKHVAHIGWDGPSGTGPSWMNEFKTAPDFSTSIGSLSGRKDPNPTTVTTSRSTRDFEGQPTPNKGIPSAGVARVTKKPRRKKTNSTSSPKSSAANSSRQSRATRTKAMYCESEPTPIALADSNSIERS